MCLTKKFQNNLVRSVLITIFKSLIRRHLDYSSNLKDQEKKILTFIWNWNQFSPMLPQQSLVLWEELLKKSIILDLKSLQQKQWYEKLCWFCLKYIKNSIPYWFAQSYSLTYHINTTANIQKSFLSLTILGWKKIDFRNLTSKA